MSETLKNFVKDKKTGVVTNTDPTGLAEYKMKITKAQELNDLKYKVNSLCSIISQLQEKLTEQDEKIKCLVGLIERGWK
jgi:hypothetical protein